MMRAVQVSGKPVITANLTSSTAQRTHGRNFAGKLHIRQFVFRIDTSISIWEYRFANRHVDFDFDISICETMLRFGFGHVDSRIDASISIWTCRFANRRFDSGLDLSVGETTLRFGFGHVDSQIDASISIWTCRFAKRHFDFDFDASIRKSTLRCLKRRLRSPRQKIFSGR
jgi:hypothetical protein